MTSRLRRESPAAADRYLCPADNAIRLAHQGIRRSAAVQLAEHALSCGDCARNPRCVRHAVLTLVYAGDLLSAEAHCAAALARPAWRPEFTLLQARIQYLMGDCTGPRKTMARHPHGPATPWLAEILTQQGEPGRAEALLVGAEDRAEVLAARAAVHVATGRFALAVDEYLACGKRLAEARITNPAVLPWRSRAALAALATGRGDLASALAHDELVAARRWGSPAAVGAALHPVALLRADDGTDLLADAVRLLDVARTRNEQVWALYDLGLLHHGRHDHGAARANLVLAAKLAARGGMTRWSRRVRSALDGLVTASTELTRQEARIARLAAAGHSNKQIAAKLCLTVRTIEFHLSGVYRKLGISGRRELGAVIAALF